ncbi:XdhC family protein [Kordiimonas marina]|uniref:XdhC family protein n=1 Tax=Kordiimonas marina TaxID=2872312 RepID=UPI001FF1B59C|nr:XdhC family protein [Kordiimonas marina]MCJ9430203.1 XdhC family protein [Kordiimonas marina]
MQTELESLIRWQAAGYKTALALVLATWGSAPRMVGSLMTIRADGTFEGSVSGGCVEGTVIAEAVNQMAKGGARQLCFKVSEEDAWSVGLACGGEIQVGVLAITPDAMPALTAALEARRNRQMGLLTFDFTDGSILFDAISIANGTALPERPTLEGDRFLLPVRPKPRLDIIGAVHIAQTLAPMASSCGYDVTVIDPRAAFIESRDFGDANTVEDWPDDYFGVFAPDKETAVVALTHDPKLDDAALLAALHSPAFYIGALGSRKTHAARLERLAGKGATDDSLTRIHGPVGLNIGAKTPAEIAISILAEITQVRRAS